MSSQSIDKNKFFAHGRPQQMQHLAQKSLFLANAETIYHILDIPIVYEWINIEIVQYYRNFTALDPQFMKLQSIGHRVEGGLGR